MTTKRRLEIVNAPVHMPGVAATLVDGVAPAQVSVVDVKSGAVTFIDRVKGYYKGLFTLVGVLLMILNEATPVFDFIVPDQYKNVVTGVIGFLTVLSTFLKQNQQWVDDL